jgi:uncharacterized protein YndB with AHSA1/START domain
MKLDQFKPLTVYTIYIAATPDKVWEALTSAEFSLKYFSGFAVEMEPRLAANSSCARLTDRNTSRAMCSNTIRRTG